MSHSPHLAPHDEERLKLREQFKGASKFLAKTRLSDKRSLSNLPWYILLGPTQVGKTSLLAHSEQEFILAKKSHRLNLHSISPTQYCDWWATQEAVYADLSGQFTKGQQNPADHPTTLHDSLWREIIRLFANYQRQNKQVGVIVVISASALTGHRDELLNLAAAIHNQLLSLKSSFKKAFPIYLIINRLDSLSGFSDFFYDLSREERSQAWGFTCHTKDLSFVETQFDQLLRKLNEQLLFRLQQQSQLSQRAKIHDFPMEMANLKPRLLDFMQQALPEKKGLAWHSVYFTSSATKSADYIIGKSLAHLHPAFNESTHKNSLPKAYFVEHLLKQFIQRHNQQQLMSHNKAKAWYRRATYLMAGLIIAAGASAWAYEFNRQLNAIHHTEQVLAKYQVLTQTKQTTLSLAEQIVLLDTLKQASDIHPSRFSPSKVNKLQTAAAEAYQLALQKLLLPHLTHLFTKHLASPVTVEPAKLYSTLQAYLMLNSSEHRQPQFIEGLLVNAWQETKDYDAKLLPSLHDHLIALFEKPLPAVSLNEPLIAAARLRLNQLTPIERSYIILHNLTWHPKLTLYPYSNSASVKISSFYTKEALLAIYAKELAMACQQGLSGNWLLGNLTADKPYDPLSIDNLKSQVSDLYLADYAHHWQRILMEFSELPLTNPAKTPDLLDQLLNAQSKLNQALAIINNNTQIGTLTQGYSSIITHKLKEKFASLHNLQTQQNLWQALQIKLRQLQIYLLQMKLSGDFNEAAYTAAKTRILAANASNPITDLAEFAKELPNPWQSWLQQLASNSWQYILLHAYAHLAQIWQQQIYTFYSQNIANLFPFAKTLEAKDVSLNNFKQFFAPTGLLNNYFISLLKPFLDTSNTHWQLKSLDNQILPIAAETLSALQQAAIIQRMFYPQQQTEPTVKFNLATLAIDARIRALQLTIGDKVLTYPGEIESIAVKWPDAQNNNRVKLTYQDQAGPHQLAEDSSAWSLFRLVKQGSLIISANPKPYVLALNANDNLLQFELNAEEPINPFANDLLANFKLPEKL
ncbi:MAG: hypothetical protein K0S11_834 [Gammaproteobacteria bacterium]|jgi:type VI secretion system protein ImpL|nr:hypothetical protein [Gammaproteobacteria bacterium]